MIGKPLCFVVMGYGIKEDPVTKKKYDMDEVYQYVVKPVVEGCGYECIRGDEVNDDGLIDASMFALLVHANLVVADITTLNANAMYELGVRHAAKPFTTIIMASDTTNLPFDINHNRMLTYKSLDGDIGMKDGDKIKQRLKDRIDNISPKTPFTDSPLFLLLKEAKPVQFSDDDFYRYFQSKYSDLYRLQLKAKELKSSSRFTEAARLWHQCHEKATKEISFVQQEALCTYKSKEPNEEKALEKALKILDSIAYNKESETLGLFGAIYKRLYLLHLENTGYLENALQNYRTGYETGRKDYYTGENYAFCLGLKAIKESKGSEERIFYKINMIKICKEILDIYHPIKDGDKSRWKLATLSNCFLVTGNDAKAAEYEGLFKGQSEPWEWESFKAQEKEFRNILKELKS